MAKLVRFNPAKVAKKVAKRATIVTAAAFSLAMQEQSADVMRAAMQDIAQTEGEHAIIVDMFNDFIA